MYGAEMAGALWQDGFREVSFYPADVALCADAEHVAQFREAYHAVVHGTEGGDSPLPPLGMQRGAENTPCQGEESF